jgi:hypothetical protein
MSKPAHVPVERNLFNRFLGLCCALAGIGLILHLDARLRAGSGLPEIGRDMSYGLLFGLGFLAGFHCVGMCGALAPSYAAKSPDGKLRYGGHLLYGLGKTLSYTFNLRGFRLGGRRHRFAWTFPSKKASKPSNSRPSKRESSLGPAIWA